MWPIDDPTGTHESDDPAPDSRDCANLDAADDFDRDYDEQNSSDRDEKPLWL